MRRWVSATVVVLTVAAVVGVFVTWLQRQRTNRDYVYSANNLREIGQFAELYLSAQPNRPVGGVEAPGRPRFAPVPVERLKELGIAPEIPAGTVAHPTLPPGERLSWIVPLLPTFNQVRQPTEKLFGDLDRGAGWKADANRPVANTPLSVLQVYANPVGVPSGEPALTQFVGVGGLGLDAPGGPRSNKSGAFRYDEPTPFELFTDGLSETALFADVSTNLGPWLAGGPPTVRPLDPAARVFVGPNGVYGGNFPAGGLFGYADHSVRVVSPRVDPAVVMNAVTLAGGGAGDPTPGE